MTAVEVGSVWHSARFGSVRVVSVEGGSRDSLVTWERLEPASGEAKEGKSFGTVFTQAFRRGPLTGLRLDPKSPAVILSREQWEAALLLAHRVEQYVMGRADKGPCEVLFGAAYDFRKKVEGLPGTPPELVKEGA